MRTVLAILVALSAFGLVGCDTQRWFKSQVPAEEASLARRYLEDVRTGNFGPVEGALDPAYRSPALGATLGKMAALFPPGNPKSIELVGWQTMTVAGTATTTYSTYNLTYEYEFPHGWALGHTLLKKQSGRIEIERIDVQQLRASLAQINAFRLTRKSSIQYLILLLAITLPIFTLVTAIACFRTPIPKWKWAWIIFVLFGFGSISLNWTTGAVAVKLASIILLSAEYNQVAWGSGVGPVILQIAFPLGAVIFWIRRRRWVTNNLRLSESFQ